jgi:hypothetical protein
MSKLLAFHGDVVGAVGWTLTALLHFTIWSSESDGATESHLGPKTTPWLPPQLTPNFRFKPFWKRYKIKNHVKHRTSGTADQLRSTAGASCGWIPRVVPFVLLKPMFAWTALGPRGLYKLSSHRIAL